MLSLSTDERIALLLSVLGPDAERAAMKDMHPTRAQFVGKLLQEYKADPPSETEIRYIIDDFTKYFNFAISNLKPEVERVTESRKAEQRRSKNAEPEPLVVEDDEIDRPTIFEPIPDTGDVVDNLNQLDPYQISMALANDHPKTIAIVLDQLTTRLGAAILKNLDDEMRNQSVVYLSQGCSMPDRVVQQILQTTFDKANAVTVRKEQVNRAEVLARLMRSLPKEMRSTLIDTLTAEDEDMVQEIRSNLYVFEDILRLEDRDTQKLISETKSDLLVVALLKAPEDIANKLLSNLSKRARQAIEDEIQYQTNVSPQEIELARKELVETLGRLDEAGEVTLK